MLVNLKDILKDCEQHKYAVGSFNTPTLETLRLSFGLRRP